MIEIDHLCKRFGKFVAIEDLSLRVEDGEIFGFLGPNGAGKTTTIKAMAGLIKPTAGEVRIDGLSVQRQPLAAKQRLGVVPDRPFLYEKLTGREFLSFMCGLYGVPDQRGRRASEELLRLFQLEGWGDELIEGYSHGMKQRLVMAGAFVHDPRALVIDEPTVGLDPQGTRLLKEVFSAFARRRRTVFLSTHSLAAAEEVCDRIGILSHGRLVASGTLDELRARARSEGDLESVFFTLTREDADGDGTAAADADALLDAVLLPEGQPPDSRMDP
ncbi:MAG: ABC transporter ATP-binding protein [Deltaproteobacteria bacterium]|nr:ABC transporter ATP-binding protein [Deltaproteobacteria bacterium]